MCKNFGGRERKKGVIYIAPTDAMYSTRNNACKLLQLILSLPVNQRQHISLGFACYIDNSIGAFGILTMTILENWRSLPQLVICTTTT